VSGSGSNPFSSLLRSKGFVWLASQPGSCFQWAYAGCHFSLKEHCQWSQLAPARAAAPARTAAVGVVPIAAPPLLPEAGRGRGGKAPPGGGKARQEAADWARAEQEADADQARAERQQLVFIGLSLPEDQIAAMLDKCLLRDWEMAYFARGLVPPALPPADETDHAGDAQSLLPRAKGPSASDTSLPGLAPSPTPTGGGAVTVAAR
jgi:hypothetical protein